MQGSTPIPTKKAIELQNDNDCNLNMKNADRSTSCQSQIQKVPSSTQKNGRIIKRRKSRGYIKCEHREEKHYSNGMCKRCYHKKYFKERVQNKSKDTKSQTS